MNGIERKRNWDRIGRRCNAVVVAAVVAVAASSLADVTGVTNDITLKSGARGVAQLRLQSDTPVDAINGEIMYDPALLLDPVAAITLGSGGFTAMSNEVQPGLLRFVLFKNPADQTLGLNAPVLNFGFTAVGGLATSMDVPVTYTMAAAAMIDPTDPMSAISIGVAGTVDFQSFTVSINSTYVEDWVLYE